MKKYVGHDWLSGYNVVPAWITNDKAKVEIKQRVRVGANSYVSSSPIARVWQWHVT